jgi:hypothetical protein
MNVNPLIISIGSLICTLIGLLFTYNKNRGDLHEAETKLRERLTALEIKISVFWDSLSRDAAKILHTPHEINKFRDHLLEKFLDETITRDELAELIDILKKIIEDKDREFGERTAASTLLRALQGRYEISV